MKKDSWCIKPIFSIELHIRDLSLLEKIHKFFQVGNIIIRNRNKKKSVIYSVQSVKDINNVIIPHFLKYPLLTQKIINFRLFCLIINKINNKEHLNIKGVKKIISIRASLNKGLSNELKEHFPDSIPINISEISISHVIKNPYWLTGFVDAEGCFYIKPVTFKSKIVKYSLVLSISQHSRDKLLMIKIIEYLKCGLLECPKTRKESRYVVYNYSDHLEKIIPFFIKYPLLSTKLLDFQDFYKVSNLLKKKEKLKEEDISFIRHIKSNMNNKRKFIEE